jgi:peptide/nickel transport system substrate-binding protein
MKLYIKLKKLVKTRWYVMKKKRILISALSLSLIISGNITLGGCFEKPHTQVPNASSTVTENLENQSELKTVTCQLKGEPASLDPAFMNNTVTTIVTSNIFEGLVTFKETSVEIEPALAEKWEISNNNLEYTFTLRNNVKFHDGTPFNADSVVTNFNRLKKIKLEEDNASKKVLDVISDIQKIDDYHVKFILSRQYTPFLADLAMNILTPIVSQNSIKSDSAPIDIPIGTGPFKFSDWKKTKVITLEKNIDYWGKKPSIDVISFRLDTLSTQNARALLNNGEIDIIDLEKPKNDKNTYYYKSNSLFTSFIALNCSKQPFSDKDTRKAFAQALNRQDLYERYFDSNGTFANSFLPPEINGYNSSIKFYPYNIDLAKQLVNKSNPAIKKIVAADIYFQNPAIYLEISNNLKKLGFEVEFRQNLNEESFLQMKSNNSYDMIIAGWQCDNGDADNYMGLIDSKNLELNLSKYNNKNVDDLISIGNSLPNGEERYNTYKKIQTIVEDDVPIIPLLHAGRTFGLSSKVKNFRVHPTGAILFKYMDIGNNSTNP